MTPETGYFLAKARRLLDEAEGMLTMRYNEAAGQHGLFGGISCGTGADFGQDRPRGENAWWGEN